MDRIQKGLECFVTHFLRGKGKDNGKGGMC